MIMTTSGGFDADEAGWAVFLDSGQEAIEAFRQALASLRERVGNGSRTPAEEDLQRLSNRRFHLARDFAAHKRQIEIIVAEHHTLAPQLRLRVLGTA
jgi:hypothetical protein